MHEKWRWRENKEVSLLQILSFPGPSLREVQSLMRRLQDCRVWHDSGRATRWKRSRNFGNSTACLRGKKQKFGNSIHFWEIEGREVEKYDEFLRGRKIQNRRNSTKTILQRWIFRNMCRIFSAVGQPGFRNPRKSEGGCGIRKFRKGGVSER